MKNYLMGDWHLGHNGIATKFRKCFSSDEEHDNTIKENILSVSGKRNILYGLGDLVFKTEHFSFIDQISSNFSQVHFILGNHEHKNLARYCSQFDNIYLHGLLSRWGTWLSHAPVHPQEFYRKEFNIHGHCHENDILCSDGTRNPRYINLSAEKTGYKPISLEEVKETYFNES